MELCLEFGNMNPKIMTNEMVEFAVGSDANCFSYVPEKLMTPKICTLAVLGNPYNLASVPKSHRSAEMCLFAVKSDPKLIEFAPSKIVRGDNIYSFAERLEKKWPNAQNLTFEQVTKLYSGETIRLNGVQLNNPVKDQIISYDKDAHKISIRPITENKISRTELKNDKRKGLKM